MSETKCECPARKALAAAEKKLSGITLAWEKRKAYGQGTAAFLSVDTTFGQVREAAETEHLIRAALSAPCPCEGLREEVGRLTERAQEAMAYGRKNFDAALGFQDRALRAEAERDQLRAALVRKINDYSRLWAECDQLRAALAEARREILNLTTSKTITEYERGETVTLESLLEDRTEDERDKLRAVAQAAKDIADCGHTDIDPRLKYLEVQVSRREWAALKSALAELAAVEQSAGQG